MISFTEWLNKATIGNEMVDASQIDRIYDKCKYAVKIVQIYDNSLSPDKKLLLNISTIANLSAGAYGLYNSAENDAVLGQGVEDKIRFKFGPDFKDSKNLPRKIIKQYLPEIPKNMIQPSDTIHINVSRIVKELGDSLKTILQIASTIVHEAQHELERRETGYTSETGPLMAERQFTNWFKTNLPMLKKQIPQLNSIR